MRANVPKNFLQSIFWPKIYPKALPSLVRHRQKSTYQIYQRLEVSHKTNNIDFGSRILLDAYEEYYYIQEYRRIGLVVKVFAFQEENPDSIPGIGTFHEKCKVPQVSQASEVGQLRCLVPVRNRPGEPIIYEANRYCENSTDVLHNIFILPANRSNSIQYRQKN